MAKSSWQSNHSNNTGQWTVIGVVGLTVIIFLLLPLLKNPIHATWRWVRLSESIARSVRASTMSPHECIVLATPPKKQYDVVDLECSPDQTYSTDNFVWSVNGGVKYLVGRVISVQESNVVAKLYTSYNPNGIIEIRFEKLGDKYAAIPIGGGALRVEVPADVAIVDGATVYHAVSGQPLGGVSGVRLERGSYVKRAYIRLPFSVESVTRLEVR